MGGPAGAELVVGSSELVGVGSSGGSSGVSFPDEVLAVTVVPAATAIGAAPEPAMVKNPPPTPPTTTMPAATSIVSPLLTVVVGGGALLVGIGDEIGGLVIGGGFVVAGGAEEGMDVGANVGTFVIGGKDAPLLDGISPPVEVPFDCRLRTPKASWCGSAG